MSPKAFLSPYGFRQTVLGINSLVIALQMVLVVATSLLKDEPTRKSLFFDTGFSSLLATIGLYRYLPLVVGRIIKLCWGKVMLAGVIFFSVLLAITNASICSHPPYQTLALLLSTLDPHGVLLHAVYRSCALDHQGDGADSCFAQIA